MAAGVSFVQKSLESFNVRSVKTTLLVDMFGYDAFPALASLQDTHPNRGFVLVSKAKVDNVKGGCPPTRLQWTQKFQT